MVSVAPEICARRSEMAHPCRGSRASVSRISRSSVPCGRSVWGIGIIRDPLYFDKRLARLMSKCKTSATGFEDSESHRIVLDGWPRDSPFEIAPGTSVREGARSKRTQFFKSRGDISTVAFRLNYSRLTPIH